MATGDFVIRGIRAGKHWARLLAAGATARPEESRESRFDRRRARVE